MPEIVDYAAVVAQTARQGLVSLYPNSGAFGFPADRPVHAAGWVIGDDPTWRPAARTLAQTIAVPTPGGLAALAESAWRQLLPGGPVWVLPKAHWAYELDFGSAAWMPDLLRGIGVDPVVLSSRHDGSAVAFAPAGVDAPPHRGDGDGDAFVVLVEGLLANLLGSDFQLLFPDRDVACTVHHHNQLWWTSPDEVLIAGLRGLAG